MQAAPLPADEPVRLRVLHELAVLDTAPEDRFDRITALAQTLLDVPIALVSLVDRDRQWFKSRRGLEAKETPRRIAFCAHTILQPDPMVVADVTRDERFHDNPLVTGYPHARFYAACPLLLRGHAVGTLCVIDREPRLLTAEQLQGLQALAAIVSDELERGTGHDRDPLTGLPNHQGFMLHGDHVLRRAVARGDHVSLLRVDVHLDPDGADRWATLERLGTLFQGALCEAEVVARLQGGAFALLFAGDGCGAPSFTLRQLTAKIEARFDPAPEVRAGTAVCRPRAASQLALAQLLEAAEHDLDEQDQARTSVPGPQRPTRPLGGQVYPRENSLPPAPTTIPGPVQPQLQDLSPS